MDKYIELLFLKQLKGIGTGTINSNYLSILKHGSEIDDLLKCFSASKKYSEGELKEAYNRAKLLYETHVSRNDIRIITALDPEYPKQLNDLKNKKPVILYYRGNTELLNALGTAVIGTRKPSSQSRTEEISLVKTIVNKCDRTIVSGLAIGCDQVAHETTVQEGGKTLAILPSGLDNIYPATNKTLAKDILDAGGGLLSEYELDSAATKFTFLDRDRIIAAIAKECIVVECSAKSGTMHSVNTAYDLNRKIGCYDGIGMDGDFSGNQMILNKLGGTRITSDDSIIEFFADAQQEQMQLNLF